MATWNLPSLLRPDHLPMLAARLGFRHRVGAMPAATPLPRATAPDLRLLYFYDIPLPSRKAAPIQFLNTARALADQGVQVVILSGPLAFEDPDRVLRCYGIEPHPGLALLPFFPGPPRTRRWTLRSRLARLIPPTPGTVVMSRGETGVALHGAFRRLAAPRPPFVYEAHRLGFERKAETATGIAAAVPPLGRLGVARARRRERRVVEEADALVCLTDGVRTALAAHFDIEGRPSLVLPSGTHCRGRGELPPLHDPGRDIEVLYVGKLAARKGVDQLVGAWRHMPEVTVAVVGGSDPERAQLRRQAIRVGIPEDRLLLPGWVPPPDLPAWYRRARVGVCPLPAGESATAERYTSPMKILEMMAEGVPVVATDVPAVRELLRDGSTALLVPPNRPERLAEAVLRLLRDPELAGRLRRNGLRHVRGYCWPERARRLSRFLRALAAP